MSARVFDEIFVERMRFTNKLIRRKCALCGLLDFAFKDPHIKYLAAKMSTGNLLKSILFGLIVLVLVAKTEAGVIKDLYNKITNSNSSGKSEGRVEQSAPVCGSSIFSSSNKESLSPEIIFITNRESRSEFVDHNDRNREHHQQGSNHGRDRDNERESESRRSHQRGDLNEVAREYRFNFENVTLQDLERHGFNPEAPVTFLMHGFTSGYPLQAWISAIVEAYTIDRESGASHVDSGHTGETYENSDTSSYRSYNSSHETSRRRGSQNHNRPSGGEKLRHNLFIVNWNYAARGIIYPRAVANIPTVASYVTRFINEKLIEEARVEPRRIQLIGHSLGAHLAGFIGKNTKSKVGRIYGLDPAGPCFGTISGSLYPSSNRLAPSDAEEVITIHTNSALLGIDKPLGRYSVFVEGGSVQPGCRGGGVLKSIGTLTWDGGDFDTVACSHSRAPNLLTYRHDQTDSDDNCQLVAYECKDWDSFLAGHCGECRSGRSSSQYGHLDSSGGRGQEHSLKSVECLRIGLDWQYSTKQTSATGSGFNNNHRETEWQRPTTSSYSGHSGGHPQYDENYSGGQRENSPSRRPANQHSTSSYDPRDEDSSSHNGRSTSRRPHKSGDGHSSHERNRRESSNSSRPMERRGEDAGSVPSKSMFLRTGDTQPYCAYHYQIVLELNEPFESKKPPMSLLLQDSQTEGERRRPSGSSGQHSLSSDQFGNRFDERTYTHLLTSNKKLKKVDHGTLIFREGLPNGYKILKSLQVNYMSHSEPSVRQRLSSRLCLAKTDTNTGRGREDREGNRFYFEPCDRELSSNSNNDFNHSKTSRRPSYDSGTKPSGPYNE